MNTNLKAESRIIACVLAVGWFLPALAVAFELELAPGDPAWDRKWETVAERYAAGEDVLVTLETGRYVQGIRLVRPVGEPDSEGVGSITIRAGQRGKAVFSESKPLLEWEKINFRTYVHPFPEPLPEDSQLFLFYDGAWLEQRQRRIQIETWDTYLSARPPQVYLAIPEDAEPDFSKIAMAAREPEPLLRIEGFANVVLDGLVFEYDFAGQDNHFPGPFIGRCRNVTIQDCSFRQNLRGLEVLEVDGLAIRDCEFRGSGFQGVLIGYSSDVDLVGLTITHNGQLSGRTRELVDSDFANVTIVHPRGHHRLARTRLSDGYAGVVVDEIRGGELLLEELVLGYHEGPGIHLEGSLGGVSVANNRVGYNRGGALVLVGELANRAGLTAEVSGNIFFQAEGGPVIRLKDATLKLQGNIVVSRSDSSPLFKLDGVAVYEGSGNLFFHRNLGDTAFNGVNFGTWAADPDHPESNSAYGDPLFLDTENLEFDMDFQSPWYRQGSW